MTIGYDAKDKKAVVSSKGELRDMSAYAPDEKFVRAFEPQIAEAKACLDGIAEELKTKYADWEALEVRRAST